MLLAGCTEYYDYYESDVRYTQDGEDCVYYMDESGRRFSGDVRAKDSENKVVYRNTRCADLFARKNAEPVQDVVPEYKVFVKPIAQETYIDGVRVFGCNRPHRHFNF